MSFWGAQVHTAFLTIEEKLSSLNSLESSMRTIIAYLESKKTILDSFEGDVWFTPGKVVGFKFLSGETDAVRFFFKGRKDDYEDERRSLTLDQYQEYCSALYTGINQLGHLIALVDRAWQVNSSYYNQYSLTKMTIYVPDWWSREHFPDDISELALQLEELKQTWLPPPPRARPGADPDPPPFPVCGHYYQDYYDWEIMKWSFAERYGLLIEFHEGIEDQ